MASIYPYALTLAMAMCASCATLAQSTTCSYTLSGKITDEHDQSALEYATVYIAELQRGATADANGHYILQNLCKGQYTVLVRHVGCESKTLTVTLSDHSTVNFALEHHIEQLQEVTVAGEAQKVSSSVTTEQLSDQDIRQAKGKTLGATLEAITGVNSLQSGPTISKPVIHGLHSNRIVIMNNGVRQEGQQWGQEHAPEIDPFSATSFRVVKGAATVRYGADAIGGIVLVEPAALPHTKAFGGSVQGVAQSNNRQGTLASTWQKGYNSGWGWRVQASAKKAGDSHAPRYNLSNTGVEELNFSIATGVTRPTYSLNAYYSHFSANIGIMRSAHIGNQSDLINAINSDKPLFIEDFTYTIDHPRQDIAHDLVKLSGEKQLTKNAQLTWQYAFQANQRKEYDRRRGNNFNKPSISLDIYTHTLDLALEQTLQQKWIGEYGISSTYQRNKNNAGTNASFLIPDYKNYGAGLFAIQRYVQQHWELEAGIRYDWRTLNPLVFNSERELLSPKYTFHNITASVGAQADIGEHWQLKANVASAWRPPHISELFSNGLHHGAAAIEEGLLYSQGVLSPELLRTHPASEQAVKSIATVTHQQKNWHAEISGYYNLIHNYIYLRPSGTRLSIRGAFPVFQYARTNARFAGVDATVGYQFTSHWAYQAKGSWLHATDTKANDVLINVPANRMRHGITYRTQSPDKKASWYTTAEVLAVAKQGRAPQVFIHAEGEDPPSTIYDFKAAPDGYTVLNFHSGVEFSKFNVGFSIENLLNTSYRNYMNRFRYYADETGINFSLRLLYTF